MASLRRYDSGQLDAFDEIVVLESRADFGCEGCVSIASVADRGNTALPGCRTSLRRPDCRRKRLIVIDGVYIDKVHYTSGFNYDRKWVR